MTLDEDDIKKITEMLAEQMKSLQTEVLPTAIKSAVKAATKSVLTTDALEDRLKASEEAAAAAAAAAAEEKAKADGSKQGGDSATKAALAALQAKVAASEQRAKEAEAAAKASRLNTSIRQALLEAGASPDHITAALTVVGAEGSFQIDDAGEVVFTKQGEYGPETLSAADGAKEFLETKTGAIFLPPTGQEGTGAGVGRSKAPTGATSDPHEILANAMAGFGQVGAGSM